MTTSKSQTDRAGGRGEGGPEELIRRFRTELRRRRLGGLERQAKRLRAREDEIARAWGMFDRA